MAKLTSDELKDLRQLTEDYNKVKFTLGELDCQISEFDDKIASLESEKYNYLATFKSLLEKDKQLSATLSEKYGNGQINMETGEITEYL